MSRGFGRALAPALLILAGASGAGFAQAPDAAGSRFSPPDAPEAAPPAPGTEPPVKAIPDTFGEAVGTWDLSLDGTNRRCTLTLSNENGKNGRIVRFPAGCRRALPLLGQVAGWIFADRGIRLVDDNIRPVLKFAARPDRGSLFGKAEAGGTYNLVPLQTAAMLPPEPAPVAPATELRASAGTEAKTETPAETAGILADVAGGRAIPGSQPVLAANALTTASGEPPNAPAPTPGIYALDRFNEKDVCRVELAPRPQNATSDKVVSGVRVLPGCKDSGLTVFDPIAWRFANGHMTLKARKGHAVNLIATGDGSWRRDPDVGTTFVLRRVE